MYKQNTVLQKARHVVSAHVVTLPLRTTEDDTYELAKRFRVLAHIHNVLVKHAKRLLDQLASNTAYQTMLTEYKALLKKTNRTKENDKRKKQLSKQLSEIIKACGLTEAGLQAYIKVCARQYRKSVSSQQVQKEATRVYAGVEKVLYGNGKTLHFKKCRDVTTICGKTNTNGVKFNKATMSVDWLGLHIECKMPHRNSKRDKAKLDYIIKALDSDISYCEIKRAMFPNGWHYYVSIYLRGDAPHKLKTVGERNDATGIDIGTSTVAAVSGDSAMLQELAPRCKEYNKRIVKLQCKLDTSRRLSNPNKYKPDGTIDKANHDKWQFSNTYYKTQNQLKSLYRQKSAYIKQSHRELINKLLGKHINFVVENMSFHALQKRAAKTERQEQATAILQKDGTTKKVYKYKRKKRFGKSLNNRAPASFVAMLAQKALLYGGCVVEVDTKQFRASQYDHAADTYVKHTLGEREKTIDGHYVQRDLYSAFLLHNTNKDLTAPDRDKCIYEFDHYLQMQNNLISTMKAANVSMKQCFGF